MHRACCLFYNLCSLHNAARNFIIANITIKNHNTNTLSAACRAPPSHRGRTAKKLRGPPPRKIYIPANGVPLPRPRLAALPSVSQLRPVRGPAVHAALPLFHGSAPSRSSTPSRNSVPSCNSAPSRGPAVRFAAPAAIRPRHRYSHFLNLKNQNVKHETKIIRHTANIYPAGMTCPPASITQSSSGMALKFMP